MTPSLRTLALLGVAAALAGCEKLPNVPPAAQFVFSPVAPIVAGFTSVLFNASGSQDSDGNIATYQWNFGDGTPEVSGGGPTTSHVFSGGACVARGGTATYAVFLVVVDDGGGRDSISQNVTVTCP